MSATKKRESLDPNGDLPTDDDEDELVDYEADEEDEEEGEEEEKVAVSAKSKEEGLKDMNKKTSDEAAQDDIDIKQKEEKVEEQPVKKENSPSPQKENRIRQQQQQEKEKRRMTKRQQNPSSDSTAANKTRQTSAPSAVTARMKPSPLASNVYLPPFRRRQLEQEEKERKLLAQQTASKVDNTPEEGQINQSNEQESLQGQQQQQKEQPTPQVQRQNWEQLKKHINGTINRLNSSTIKALIHSLFQNANLLRGKGLLAKAILRAATTSPTYSPVYVSLLAVINTKLPEVGELILTRSILTFRKSYARKDKGLTMSICTFMGHFFNQGLCHELLCLQILTVLLEGDPTDDSVEVAVQFTKVVGVALLESSPAGVHAIMERFRNLLHDGTIGKRVQYKVEELMKERRKRFEMYPSVSEELDLVEREEQIMFEIGLDDEGLNKEEGLDVFRFDDEWNENEDSWIEIQKEILGDDDDSSSDDDDDSGEAETDDSDDDEDDDGEDGSEDGVLQEEEVVPKETVNKKQVAIHDLSEQDLVHLRRTIYLTIMSSATFEECTHKLAKVEIPMGKEMELINMIIECCSQERTFLRYYGLISSRFCLLHDRWRIAFEEAFGVQYETIHRLETNKLRNVAKLFAHLLHTDSLPWSCLSVIHLNEDETTSSSRIFLKILVQEMAGAIGIASLVKRFETDDPEAMEWYKELFPKDNPRKTKYAINFFTSIGLGPLTDDLREHLKNAPKLIMMQAEAEAKRRALEAANKDSDSDSDSDDSSSLSSSSSGSSTSSSSLSSSDASSSSYTTYSSSSGSSYSSYSSDESSVSRRRGRSSRGRRSGRKDKRTKSDSKKKSKKTSKKRSKSNSSSSYSSNSRSRRSSFSSRSDDDDKKKRNNRKKNSTKGGTKRRRSRSRSTSDPKSTIPSEIGGEKYTSRNDDDDVSFSKRKESKRRRRRSNS